MKKEFYTIMYGENEFVELARDFFGEPLYFITIRTSWDIKYRTSYLSEAKKYCDNLNCLDESCLEEYGQFIDGDDEHVSDAFYFLDEDDDRYIQNPKFKVVKITLEDIYKE